MKLHIDNHDGLGPRDYSGYVRPESVRLTRKFREPASLTLTLLADAPDFTVPAGGAAISFERADGAKLFTGHLSAAPQFTYLGWGERGPVFEYALAARSEEWLLDQRQGSDRIAFTRRPAGDILAVLTQDRDPDIGVSNAQPGPIISYSSRAGRPWSDEAAAIALRARMVGRIHDGELYFAPVGEVTHELNDTDPTFTPANLTLQRAEHWLNRVTLTGRVEPHAHIRDHFQGDGFSLRFELSHMPFARRASVIFEDEFESAALDPRTWSITDPTSALQITSGRLNASGGAGFDGATRVELAELIEMGGAIIAQTGDVTFAATVTDAVLGGFYNGAVSIASCVAGFRVRDNAGQPIIIPLINGVEAGQSLSINTAHRYLLTARVFISERFRREQTFHGSQHPAGSGLGGAENSASARIVLEVHDVDPAQPGTLAAPSIILYDGTLAAVPAFCTYALVNAAALHASIGFARLTSGGTVQIRSTIPGQSTRTRLTGFTSEGGECTLFGDGTVRFHSPYVPVAGELIEVTYRGTRRSAAQLTDEPSITAHARPGDDGLRAAALRLIQPPARTSAECELAARALLADSTQPPWEGKYECWNQFLPGGAATDLWPGDAVHVFAPTPAAELTAIIREVEITLGSDAEQLYYQFTFANDAAQPLAIELADTIAGRAPETVATTTAPSAWCADLPGAIITAITSTTITVDAGADPLPGGGFEVRQSDFGWGTTHDRNLVARFTTRQFTVSRLARIHSIYLRAYDAGSPRRYSRHSTLLYVDVPYQP